MEIFNEEIVMNETENSTKAKQFATTEELERVLAVGRLLLSVLTLDELVALDQSLRTQDTPRSMCLGCNAGRPTYSIQAHLISRYLWHTD